MTFSAFISYSQAKDVRLAKALRSGIQSLAKPLFQLRATRVFLDESILGLDPSLWGAIKNRLDQAEFFVLLASPQSAESEWVNREVQYWLDNYSTDKLLIVQTDGDIVWDNDNNDFDWRKTDCLAKTFANRFANCPFWLDLRWARNEKHLNLRNDKFRNAVASLSATLRHKDKDELIGEEIRQQKKAKTLALAAVVALVILTAFAFYSAYRAEQLRRQEALQRQIAEVRYLSLQAEQALVQNPEFLPRSTLLAIEAIRRYPDPNGISKFSQSALRQSIAAQKTLRESLQLRPRLAATFFSEDPKETPRNIAFSSDGKNLVTFGSQVRFWDIAERKQNDRTDKSWDFRRVLGFDEESGAWLAADTGRLVRWLNGKQQLLLNFNAQEKPLLSRNSRVLAWLDYNFKVHVFDIVSGKEQLLPKNERSKDANRIKSISISDGGEYIAGSDGKGKINIWATKGAALIAVLQPDDPAPDGYTHTDIGFAPDDKLAVVRGEKGNEIELWNFSEKKKISVFKAEAKVEGGTIRFTADNRYLSALTPDDRKLYVWDTNTRELVFSRTFSELLPPSYTDGISFNRKANRLAAVDGNVVHVWEVGTGRELFRIPHERYVTAVAFSKDDRFLASTEEGEIRIWDLSDLEKPQLEFTSPITHFATVAASPLLAVASEDGLVRLLDKQTFHEMKRFVHTSSSFKSEVDRVELSEDERLLITTGNDDLTKVWRIEDGKEVSRLSHEGIASTTNLSKHGRFVAGTYMTGNFLPDETSVWDVFKGRKVGSVPVGNSTSFRPLFSPDGRLVANRAMSQITIWRTSDLKPVATIELAEEFNDVAFSTDGALLAASGINGALHVWRVEDGKRLFDSKHEKPLSSIAWTRDNRYLFGLRGKRSIERLAVNGADAIGEITHITDIKEFAVDSQGHYLAVIDNGGNVVLWDFPAAKKLWTATHENAYSGFFSDAGDKLVILSNNRVQVLNVKDGRAVMNFSSLARITTRRISRSGNYLALGFADGGAAVWSLADGEPIQVLKVRHSNIVDDIRDVALSGDGQYLAITAGMTGSVWNIASETEILRVEARGFPSNIALNADGTVFAMSDSANNVSVWDVATGRLVMQAKHEDSIGQIDIRRDGKYVAGSAMREEAWVWQIADGKVKFKTKHSVPFENLKREKSVRSVAFSPDGKLLATGVSDSTARLWEVDTGKEILRLDHGGEVFRVAFSEDSKYLATADFNKAVRVWDIATGALISETTYPERVMALAVNFSERQLITLDTKGVLRNSHFDKEALISEACQRSTRNLDFYEWTQFISSEQPYQKTCDNLPVHSSYIDELRRLAKNGEVDKARSELTRIGKLDPERKLDPEQELRKVGEEIFSVTYFNMEEIDVDTAITKFTLAKELNDKFEYDPVSQAKGTKLEMLIKKADSFREARKFEQSLAVLMEADSLDSEWVVNSEIWNRLCWEGSIRRKAEQVIPACDLAVGRAGQKDKPYFLYARGLARGLMHDYSGAVADFEIFLKWADENNVPKALVDERLAWVKALKENRDPFENIDLENIQ